MPKLDWTKPTLQRIASADDSAGGSEAGFTENQTYEGRQGLNPSGAFS